MGALVVVDAARGDHFLDVRVGLVRKKGVAQSRMRINELRDAAGRAAPARRRIGTRRRLLQLIAQSRGVTPWEARALTSAPFLMSTFAGSTSERSHAA